MDFINYDPIPGHSYKHYKGNTCTVDLLAVNEETGEPTVIYRYLGKAEYHTKSISSWLSKATDPVTGNEIPRYIDLTV